MIIGDWRTESTPTFGDARRGATIGVEPRKQNTPGADVGTRIDAGDKPTSPGDAPPESDDILFASEAYLTPPEVVLEQFSGFVDEIDGGMATVTLTAESGEQLVGNVPASDLFTAGIFERDGFICRTIDTGRAVTIEYLATPRRFLSEADERAIDQEIDAAFGEADLDGE